jgi:hypothetical protein
MREDGHVKKHRVCRLVAGVALVVVCTSQVHATVYDLYYLGGQSNMDGYGRVEELPEPLAGVVEGVMIFHGNTSPECAPVDGRGVWVELRPGHGVGYASDGSTATYSDRFGVELTFARTLLERDPDAKIAIIKYSRGGTSIDRAAARDFGCWDPDSPDTGRGVNQYDHFLATVRHAMSVADDGCAALVTSTDGYGYSDPWHYDSAGYIDLGARFAEAILGLVRSCS